jgi:hypothetical protein
MTYKLFGPQSTHDLQTPRAAEHSWPTSPSATVHLWLPGPPASGALNLSGLGLSVQDAGRAYTTSRIEPQVTKARVGIARMMAFGPRAIRVVHNKEHETARQPQARVALPRGRTPSFTITLWLLPEEATTSRPPS